MMEKWLESFHIAMESLSSETARAVENLANEHDIEKDYAIHYFRNIFNAKIKEKE